jgi:hypothetical protein
MNDKCLCASPFVLLSGASVTTDQQDIVAALRDVPGIAAADLGPDAAGGPGVLRLGLQPGFDEVEVAARVGEVLREQFGLAVDAERVQLVEDAQPEPASAGARSRPVVRRMHIVSSGLQVTAEVTLATGPVVAVGTASGTATQTGVQRAVASATLNALEQLVEGRARFELEVVDVAPTGQDRTVIVTVTMLTNSGPERLTGAAGVRDDVRQAAIRATLDAVNRRVEALAG